MRPREVGFNRQRAPAARHRFIEAFEHPECEGEVLVCFSTARIETQRFPVAVDCFRVALEARHEIAELVVRCRVVRRNLRGGTE